MNTLYCYSCGAKIEAYNNYCYNCSAKSIYKFTESDFDEMWRETDVCYKYAKQIYLSPNKYKIIFFLASVIITTIAILTVLIKDFFQLFSKAIQMIEIKIFSKVDTEQAWMDVWCNLALTLISLSFFVLAFCLLFAIFRVHKSAKHCRQPCKHNS